MRVAFLLIFISLSSNGLLFSQELKSDTLEVRSLSLVPDSYNGIVKIIYPKEDAHSHGIYSFKDGLENGDFVLFWKNGSIAVKGVKIEGKRTGEFIGYYENGKMSEKSNYINGKRHGDCVIWCSNGNVVESVTYDKGKYHGKRLNYWCNGHLRYEINYQYGKIIDSEVLFRDCEGIVCSKHVYNDGEFIDAKGHCPTICD